MRAGCPRLTSLTRGAAGSQACTRGLPRLPKAPGRGGSSWTAIPAWDTDPEAPAHAAPHDVVLSQALLPLRPVSPVPSWSVAHLDGCCVACEGLPGSEQRPRALGDASVFGPGVAFSNALFMTRAGRASCGDTDSATGELGRGPGWGQKETEGQMGTETDRKRDRGQHKH